MWALGRYVWRRSSLATCADEYCSRPLASCTSSIFHNCGGVWKHDMGDQKMQRYCHSSQYLALKMFPPLLEIMMSRTSFTTGVWLLNSISKKIRNDKEGNLPFRRSSLHVENYVIQSQPDGLWKCTTLTYYAFSTLVVRLGCNPLGAARSRPTPSNHWPSGVTATLCNWMRPMWYESRTLRCVQLTFRWHQVI